MKVNHRWGMKFLIAGIGGAILGIGVYKETKHKQKKAKAEGRHIPYGPYEACIKRPLDFIISLLAIIILSPLFLITTILVKIKMGSPVVFVQERPGKDGKIFKLYKFRTMTDERDENGELLPDEQRLTGFGRKLRSTSLDELLELFNIASGTMSFVGPRPLLVRYLPRYNKRQATRHDVRSGLTGAAQVSGRNMLSWSDKLEADAKYVEKITFLGDLKIILKTVYVVLKHDDISVGVDEFMGDEE